MKITFSDQPTFKVESTITVDKSLLEHLFKTAIPDALWASIGTGKSFYANLVAKVWFISIHRSFQFVLK